MKMSAIQFKKVVVRTKELWKHKRDIHTCQVDMMRATKQYDEANLMKDEHETYKEKTPEMTKSSAGSVVLVLDL